MKKGKSITQAHPLHSLVKKKSYGIVNELKTSTPEQLEKSEAFLRGLKEEAARGK